MVQRFRRARQVTDFRVRETGRRSEREKRRLRWPNEKLVESGHSHSGWRMLQMKACGTGLGGMGQHEQMHDGG